MLRLAPDYPPPKSRRRAYLKTFLPPCLAFGTIVLGLTSYALLLRYYSPAVLQHIGWQAWDVVQFTAGGAGHASNASELLSLPLDIYVRCRHGMRPISDITSGSPGRAHYRQ